MAALLLAADAGAAPADLCAAHERAVFSCAVSLSRKLVSLCVAGDPAAGSGTLAYRFGRPGKPELEFPDTPKGSMQRFRYAHYSRSQVDNTEVSFANGGFAYTVFDYASEEPGYAGHDRGVTVAADSGAGKETRLECAGAVHSELHRLEAWVPCDTDNAMMMGGCPTER